MTRRRCVLLSGGVGGAKLALGLQQVVAPGDLTVIVNTGDDFEHLGLSISPDLDTLAYTLAGVVNPVTGWGRHEETWGVMAALEKLGGETWFRLGDLDLATHLWRTAELRSGRRLTEVTRELCARLGLRNHVLPMTDAPVRTRVDTNEGELAFQEYFVRRRAEPRVAAIRFAGAAGAQPSAEVLAALGDPALAAIIIAPSNPWLSIDPILAVPGLRDAIATAGVPVVGVSPIVAGAALKGPTARIMADLGLTASAQAVARHYAGLIGGWVMDEADATLAAAPQAPGLVVATTQTVMTSLDDKSRLARFTLQFAATIAVGHRT